SRWDSLAARSLPTTMLARLRTCQIAVVVDFDTPAGHLAWNTEPSRDRTVITRETPAGDHGMSQQRYTITAASTPPTSPWTVQLITAGAWSAVSPKSKVRWSPSFTSVTWQS